MQALVAAAVTATTLVVMVMAAQTQRNGNALNATRGLLAHSNLQQTAPQSGCQPGWDLGGKALSVQAAV